MKLSKRQRQKIRELAGIILIIGILALVIFVVVLGNIELEKLFTDDNIKCLDYCLNGKSFNMSWVCNC